MTPTILQPPDKCPACGASKMPKSNDIDTWYECSQLYQLVDGVWKPNAEWSCNRSFSAAIALRAALDDQHAATDRMHNEITALRAERDAALAREHEQISQASLVVLNLTSSLSLKQAELTAALRGAGELQAVCKLKDKHAQTWRDKPESYWFARLSQEVGELGGSLVGDHDDPPEWELKQIAAICLNWLEMRAAVAAVRVAGGEGV